MKKKIIIAQEYRIFFSPFQPINSFRSDSDKIYIKLQIMNYKVLLYYTNLALSQEDNDFVANFLKSGSKIIEKEINENSNDKYQIEIDFLHIEKGEKGLEQLFKKITSFKMLICKNPLV